MPPDAYLTVGYVPPREECAASIHKVVWSEIDRAKMFIRDLGRWCGDHPERITLGELQNLAVKWVLEFQMTPEERAEVSLWDEDRSMKRHNRSGDCASSARGDHGIFAGDTVVSA